MAAAALWGAVGGFALILGALVGLRVSMQQRAIGLVMAFGAGVLVSALAFELTAEAYDRAGRDAVALGLSAGALLFFGGDWLLDRRGGDKRKSSQGEQSEGSPFAIVLGALLDGIPESAAIGVSLLEGSGVSLAFVVAVFLSNVPESLSASAGLQKAGWSTVRVVALWSGVLAVSALAALVGYAALGDASQDTIAFVLALAAGAILTMLADTMIPEAFRESGSLVGLVTVVGFTLAFLLSTYE